jgi:predicted MFS family arabinose efflux permease
MYDRRVVGMGAVMVSLVGATMLSLCVFLGALTPANLLMFCFIIGCGMSLFAPAWQASVSEQVKPEMVPSAIALNSISYNIARSIGPAIGGIIVAAAGAIAAFIANALCYIPLLFVLYNWRRPKEPSRLPPEKLGRAIVSGVRYIVHSPSIRLVLLRTILTGAAGGSVSALMPLVARNHLGGDAQIYGLMLGSFGIGAVVAALNVPFVRQRFDHENALRVLLATLGIAIGVVALTHDLTLSVAALAVAGACWMLSVALFNIGIQLSSPRWVTGRVLAAFQASISGGIAFGGWGWGVIAANFNVETALLASAVVMVASPLVGIWLRMPLVAGPNADANQPLADPEVKLQITGRSGPVVVEIEYCIAPDNARAFYGVMQEVQLSRQRNGAYDWSISRDLAAPEHWVERFQLPTWHDYLRQRNRPTQSERDLQARATAFHMGAERPQIRRFLERPFGSVRWTEEAPDRVTTEVLPVTTPSSSGA